jgi:hypothetical protein
MGCYLKSVFPAKAGTQIQPERPVGFTWAPAGVHPRARLWRDPGAGVIGAFK